MKRNILVGTVMILAAWVPLTASGTVWSEVEDNVAYVHHDDAEFNCCPYMVFATEQRADTIDIYEQDTLPSCYCVCEFDFTHTFKGLDAGTYLARVWESDSPDEGFLLAGSTSFTIPLKVNAFSTSTWMSECHDAVGELPDPQTKKLDLKSVSGPIQKSAEIRYYLPVTTNAKLEIYDVTGTRIRSLEAGKQDAGDHIVVWDIRNQLGQTVPRGIYFVRLEAAGEARSLSIIVLR